MSFFCEKLENILDAVCFCLQSAGKSLRFQKKKKKKKKKKNPKPLEYADTT